MPAFDPQDVVTNVGVAYHLQLADLKDGEADIDLGSGSGMDTFIAALKVGPRGKVVGYQDSR
jgi:predicted methyltransferase